MGIVTALHAQEPVYNFTFTGGFQGWTSKSIECDGQASDKANWIWVDDGVIDQGAYSDFGLMNSRTPDSGIVVLNSDFLDNQGLDDNLGKGKCPAPQIAELVSPSLDFSGEDSVYLSFNQLYYRFIGYHKGEEIDESQETATFVLVSNDGGTTWTTIPVNEDVRTYRATRNYDGELTLDISNVAAGQSDVLIKFLWKGDYYLWAIDDVRFYGGRKDDLEIVAFKYPASNFETPEGEIKLDTLRFFADIVNLGNQNVDSAYLYIILRGNDDDNQGEYFRDSLLVENIAPNDTLELELPNYFTPVNLTPGAYAFIYRLRNTKRPVEVNMANNIRADVFLISETQFRKTDRGDGRGFSFNKDAIVGNYYEINENFQERMLLDKINFSVFPTGKNTLAGKEVVVYLLKIDDNVARDLSDWNFTEATDNKKSIIAIGSYTFTPEDDNKTDPNYRFEATEFINLAGENQSDPIVLQPGSRYIAAIEYTGNALELIHNISERITYYPASFGSEQFSTMIYRSEDKQWYTYGFGSGFVAVIGMDVTIEMTATENLLTKEEVRVFPNPTSDYIRIQMNLDRPQDVNVYLTDVSGKILRMTNRTRFLNETIELDVQAVPAGTYFLNVTSADGMRTEKITVVH